MFCFLSNITRICWQVRNTSVVLLYIVYDFIKSAENVLEVCVFIYVQVTFAHTQYLQIIKFLAPPAGR